MGTKALGVQKMSDFRFLITGATGATGGAAAFIRDVKEEALGWDANDLIYSLESSGDFDAESGLSRVKTKVFTVNFADDEFYRDSLQTLQRDVRAIRGGRFVVRADLGWLGRAHVDGPSGSLGRPGARI
jgi:hypothetical protein